LIEGKFPAKAEPSLGVYDGLNQREAVRRNLNPIISTGLMFQRITWPRQNEFNTPPRYLVGNPYFEYSFMVAVTYGPARQTIIVSPDFFLSSDPYDIFATGDIELCSSPSGNDKPGCMGANNFHQLFPPPLSPRCAAADLGRNGKFLPWPGGNEVCRRLNPRNIYDFIDSSGEFGKGSQIL
jgi:hypothetical protein